MPTPTYTPLANLTLSATATSVTFSSISQLYRDIIATVSYSGTTAVIRLTFNSDSGANYGNIVLVGDGTSYAGSSDGAAMGYIRLSPGTTSTVRNLTTINVLDYSATDKHKTLLSRGNHSDSGVSIVAGRWASTSAITSMTLTAESFNFAIGSTFALYGIAS